LVAQSPPVRVRAFIRTPITSGTTWNEWACFFPAALRRRRDRR
jgi:hypothetical protein